MAQKDMFYPIIDVHAHLPTVDYLKTGVFGSTSNVSPKSIEEMLSEYDEAKVDKIVILGMDAETTSGHKVSNDYMAKVVDEQPDRFIGFASVDPHKGRMAIKELERAVKDLKLKGLKLHPIFQKFSPNDESVYPLYDKCVELGIPILFHGGFELIGAGQNGGGGIKLKYAKPIFFDDVAADFPKLKICIAHPGWPWMDEQIAVVMHKGNVYMDLSGVRPKYFGNMQSLMTYLKVDLFNSKVMFGTDYPFINPDTWLKEFRELKLKPEIEKKILGENARKFLGL